MDGELRIVEPQEEQAKEEELTAEQMAAMGQSKAPIPVGPAYFVPGKLYQANTQVFPVVGTFLGTLAVEIGAGATFLVFQDENGVLLHVREEAVLAYFELTAEQLAAAKRAAMMQRMQVAQSPRRAH
jgi:hypothetical protein